MEAHNLLHSPAALASVPASRLERMFAALSATNEAILRSKSEEELYQRVCEAGVHGGKFVAVTVLIAEPGSGMLQMAAGAGEFTERLRELRTSTDEGSPHGRGIVGTAFRTQRPCVANDCLNDERTRPWHEAAGRMGIAAAAALPLVKGGSSVGVLAVFVTERNVFDAEIVGLLQRMADNVSFALDNLGREAVQRRAEDSERRLSRMFAALSATNEAILRAKTAEDLFQRVCDAAVHGGKFSATLVVVPEADMSVRIVAATGPAGPRLRQWNLTIDASRPEGRGLIGTAFRTQRPCITNDFLNDERLQAWHATARDGGTRSAAGLPLILDGASVGVLLFYSNDLDSFDDEIVALLERLAENVSFALGNFRHEAERRHAEHANRRLARMFAVLSATNEAILRAKTSEDLFQRVCDAAVHEGKSIATAVLLAEPGTSWLKPVACTGDVAERVRNLRFSTDATSPYGRGVTGSAFRTQQPCVIKDIVNDERTRAWRDAAQPSDVGAVAAAPLIQGGHSVGVLLVFIKPSWAENEDIIALIGRMANNVSFALDNFQRDTERKEAEERAHHLATHDGLTGLPNRARFGQMLEDAVRSAWRYERPFALLFVDLDDFKSVNDTLGHAAGDQLLVEIAARLKQAVRAGDIVARIGGDEFVVLVQEASEGEQVATVARKITSAIVTPVVLAGRACRVTVSIGIALYPSDGQDAESLTRNADAAMYLAKEVGKNNFRFYAKSLPDRPRPDMVVASGSPPLAPAPARATSAPAFDHLIGY